MDRGSVFLVGGKELKLYTIGELADRTGRETQTVRKWEQNGVIPPAKFRSKAGRRLYTEGQINAIASVVTKYKLKQGSLIPPEFIKEVFNAFDKANE